MAIAETSSNKLVVIVSTFQLVFVTNDSGPQQHLQTSLVPRPSVTCRMAPPRFPSLAVHTVQAGQGLGMRLLTGSLQE